MFLLITAFNTSAQTPLSFPCSSSTLTNSNGYYGGFEAGGTNGSNNFVAGAASTDYSYGNGQTEYQILMNTTGQSGYLPALPHSGDYFLTSHTSSSSPNFKLWYKTLTVSPGQIFQVCAWIADLKINPIGGFPINIVVNTSNGSTIIATKTISTPTWEQICGTYTVPSGVTTIEVEIEDPTPNFNGSSHFLGLDDICISEIPQLNLGNLVWYDANNDGIKQAIETGIAGATVNLYADVNNDNIADGAPLATILTDNTGNYNFPNLISTNYIVGVVLPAGYVAGTINGGDPDNNIANDNNGVSIIGTEIRSNAITLLVGTEPTTDGDGANGNLTLDFGLTDAQKISGSVFIDKDGLKDNNINQSGGLNNIKTNIGGLLYANLLNTAGQVVASTAVLSDGSYLFGRVLPGTYSVQLTVNSSLGTYTSPAIAPATILPEGWVNTGEFNGNTSGNDGNTDGKSASFAVLANETKTAVNFGIERLPESVSANATTPTPTLNSTINVNALTGSDPEDQPTTGVLTNKTIQITALPTNSQLLYNGVPVVLNQVITNYTPALLQIKFTTATAASSTQFSFAYVDAAGFADPTPATYRVNWTSAGVLPIILSDFVAVKKVKVVDLNWQTSNEQNSSYFDVEFSKDGSEFGSIGKVNAAGSSTTSKNYTLVHLTPVNGINYYRLKLVDVDGSFKYSAVRTVKFSTTKSIKIMPNPTADKIYITSNEGGILQSVGVYSLNGKLLQLVNNFALGKSIDLSTYAPSIYILKLIDRDGTTEIIKVVRK